jgi:hypothetical protein
MGAFFGTPPTRRRSRSLQPLEIVCMEKHDIIFSPSCSSVSNHMVSLRQADSGDVEICGKRL